MNICIHDTLHMSRETKKAMAQRLAHLMRMTPDLDTLTKVAKKSGVSYGTVRRIKEAEDVDVSIGNVEAVAKTFGLSLIEFVAPFDAATEPPQELREMLADFSILEDTQKNTVVNLVAQLAAGRKAEIRASQIRELSSNGKSKTG